MVPDLTEEARVPAEVSAEEADMVEWEDAASVRVENASAQIVAIEQLTKEVPLVIRCNAPSVEHP